MSGALTMAIRELIRRTIKKPIQAAIRSDGAVSIMTQTQFTFPSAAESCRRELSRYQLGAVRLSLSPVGPRTRTNDLIPGHRRNLKRVGRRVLGLVFYGEKTTVLNEAVL